jgi:hypothetical protein
LRLAIGSDFVVISLTENLLLITPGTPYMQRIQDDSKKD